MAVNNTIYMNNGKTFRNKILIGSGLTIQSLGNHIATPTAANQMEQNPKSISSSLGNIEAYKKNLTNSNQAVHKEYMKMLTNLYILWADAVYKGFPVEIKVRKLNPNNVLERTFIQDLKDKPLWKQAPDQVLELVIDGRSCGIFDPELRCFIPCAGFRDKNIYGKSPMEYLKDKPRVEKRCRALLTVMLTNKADNILQESLDWLGGPLSSEELKIYKAEMKQILPAEVKGYLELTSPGYSPEIICGYLGLNTIQRLLNDVTFIHTGKNAVIGVEMAQYGKELAVIPPVFNTTDIQDVEFLFGGITHVSEMRVPSWIEFTGILNGTLYHKIYAMKTEGWKIYRPENYLDLMYQVPDAILKKYNYLVTNTSQVPTLSDYELECFWEVYPKDGNERRGKLSLKQNENEEWEILQRTSRITHMELKDKAGNTLGMVFPQGPAPFKAKKSDVYLSLDPAGATSVRLITVSGSGVTEEICYEDMVHPISPMAQEEVQQVVENCTMPRENSGSHFDSLVQKFSLEKDVVWSRLMVEGRVWKPDQQKLFEALKDCPGTMTAAMTGLGVISNPKEMIARSDLKPREKQECMEALRLFIGSMLLEAVLVLARRGYAAQAGNLTVLISYPENGSGQGVTKMMQEAIQGALELVNEVLSNQNRLMTDGKNPNVELYSESEAIDHWHSNNPPSNKFMGMAVAAGTPDYGHSTHDYSFRVNGKLYTFSLPYAAQQITTATLADVYNRKAAAMMKCFEGASQELMDGATEAITKAMENKQGKLYERLGFVLPLNRLFANSSFCVTGYNADYYQIQVQQIVEARLNVAIPAYADVVSRAVRAGDLKTDSQILLAPVGKGSLAINNTEADFEERFVLRLRNEIERQLGIPYTGRIELLPNNDTEKVSVAQGLLDLKSANAKGKCTKLVERDESEIVEHYLKLRYGKDEAGQESLRQFKEEFEKAACPARIANRNTMKEELYDGAFDAIMKHYTYEDFKNSFDCWGYTGIREGVFDEEIRMKVQEDFENLMAELRQTRKALIMSCPGVEKELVAGALLDLALSR